jgi:hypothetical protein
MVSYLQDKVLYHVLDNVTGDVIHLDLLGNPVIVLNSQEAAIDLLEKRSSKYSDRPLFTGFKLQVLSLLRQ